MLKRKKTIYHYLAIICLTIAVAALFSIIIIHGTQSLAINKSRETIKDIFIFIGFIGLARLFIKKIEL